TTAAQHVLSEYLASHGFVVVYAADSGPPVLPYELPTDADRSREIRRQVERLRVALRHVRGLPNVDGARIAVLAWSYAGEAAYARQRSEPRVRIVVGISSNVVENWVYERRASAAAATLTRPYVLIDGGDKPPPLPLKDAAAPSYYV